MAQLEKAKSNIKQFNLLKERKTFWYTVNEIEKAGTCPSCGRSMHKFKNITAHAKRCFSIKKIGPVYRLHGYVECKCGILIADNTKAHKLHVCMGEIPAFEPDLSYVLAQTEEITEDLNQQETINNLTPASPRLERELLRPKPWIRNFVSPFKLDRENQDKSAKPKPRVRNFDKPICLAEPQNICVYTINSNNGAILLSGQKPKSENDNNVLLRKRALRNFVSPVKNKEI